MLLLAALASPTTVDSSSSFGGTVPTTAGSNWDPASLHLFVDHEGLAEVSGLKLVEHRPFKTYEMAVEPSEPWDGGVPPASRLSPSLSSHACGYPHLCSGGETRRTSARAHRGLLVGGPGLRERGAHLL